MARPAVSLGPSSSTRRLDRLRANIDVADLLEPPIPGYDGEITEANSTKNTEPGESWMLDDPVHLGLLTLEDAEQLILL
jgi:hypothetical protein